MRILKTYNEFVLENVSKDAVKEWKGFYLWWADDAQLFRIIALDEAKVLYPDFKDFEISDMTKEEANVLGEALTKIDPMEWEGYLNEVGYDFTNENTNVDRSISGLGKFGMLDYDKMPDKLVEKLIEKGFKLDNTPGSSYGGNAVPDQIYNKENVYDEHKHELSIGFFIDGDTKNILMDIYTFDKELVVYYNIEWKEYNKFIKLLDELNFNRFFHIEALDDTDQMIIDVKEIADEYGISVSEFSYGSDI